jgi:hypothetical protein
LPVAALVVKGIERVVVDKLVDSEAAVTAEILCFTVDEGCYGRSLVCLLKAVVAYAFLGPLMACLLTT